jgi:hypothetical protein
MATRLRAWSHGGFDKLFLVEFEHRQGRLGRPPHRATPEAYAPYAPNN